MYQLTNRTNRQASVKLDGKWVIMYPGDSRTVARIPTGYSNNVSIAEIVVQPRQIPTAASVNVVANNTPQEIDLTNLADELTRD